MFHNTKKKQIILVRHAKAMEREEWTGKDFDRPLTPEGENSNKIVANYLRLIGVKPSRIVSSPSARTRGTAEDIAKKFGITQVEYVADLYNENMPTTRDAMQVHLDVARSSKKNCNILMIVGHNSDLTDFASFLSGEKMPSMKKGSIVVLSLPENADWKTVEPGALKVIYYLTPHFLKLEALT